MKFKIKEKDNVVVLTGKDRGKTGKVEKILRQKGKAIVTGVAIVKKSTKPNKKNPKGGIISIPAPINLSNVALVCPKCSKKTKVSYKVIAKKKESICRKCKEQV